MLLQHHLRLLISQPDDQIFVGGLADKRALFVGGRSLDGCRRLAEQFACLISFALLHQVHHKVETGSALRPGPATRIQRPRFAPGAPLGLIRCGIIANTQPGHALGEMIPREGSATPIFANRLPYFSAIHVSAPP